MANWPIRARALLLLFYKLRFSFILSDIVFKAYLTIQVNKFLFEGAAAKCTPIMGVLFIKGWYLNEY